MDGMDRIYLRHNGLKQGSKWSLLKQWNPILKLPSNVFLTSTFAFHSSSIYIFLTELVSLKNCPKIVSKCNVLCGSSVQTMTSTALNIPCFLILFLVFCICIIFGLICLIFALICLIFALIHLWFICIYVCGRSRPGKQKIIIWMHLYYSSAIHKHECSLNNSAKSNAGNAT